MLDVDLKLLTSYGMGPSTIRKRVKEYYREADELNIAEMDHRSPEFSEMYKLLVERLKRRFPSIPESSEVYIVCSASEALGACANFVEKKSGHLPFGEFGEKTVTKMKDAGKQTQVFTFPDGSGPDLATVNFDDDVEALFAIRSETSMGTVMPENDVEALYDEFCTDRLLILDIVSAFPYDRTNFKKTDAVYASMQKGGGMKPGFGILVVSQRAISKAKHVYAQLKRVNFPSILDLHRDYVNFQTPATPPIEDMWVFSQILQEWIDNEEEMNRVHGERNERLRHFFQNRKGCKLSAEARYQSHTVFDVEIEGGSDRIVEAGLKEGKKIARGYKKKKTTHNRFPNYGNHSDQEFEELMDFLDTMFLETVS